MTFQGNIEILSDKTHNNRKQESQNRKDRVEKCQRKPNGQSRMDSPETVQPPETLGSQDTGRRQTKQKKNLKHNTEN